MNQPDDPEPVCNHKKHQDGCNYCEYMLTEEKKLAADWMGWNEKDNPGLTEILKYCPGASNINYEAVFRKFLELWKPNEDRNCWGPIWFNMNEPTFLQYIGYLSLGLDVPSHWITWEVHISEPESCWKSFIKTIKELKK